MLMVTVYSILGVPVLALMPVVARDMFSLGAGGYGLLLACLGIGGLAGALARRGRRPHLAHAPADGRVDARGPRS